MKMTLKQLEIKKKDIQMINAEAQTSKFMKRNILKNTNLFNKGN